MLPNPMISEIVSRYAAGERVFCGEELDTGCLDLQEADLSGADFSQAFIVADFRGANLEGCRFDGANVKTCDFRGANLRHASFVEAAVCAAKFDGADMEEANFEGAFFHSYVFSKGERP